MRVLITGVDGYLGWPLALFLGGKGHSVAGIDNFSRRKWVAEVGSDSAIPIVSMPHRLQAFESHTGQSLQFFEGDLTDHSFTLNVYRSFKPDAVVYLGEMPSAPYSMMNAEHAMYTQKNNILGTLATLFAIKETVPDCHLVKLGTMGEYGTPNLEIPEGYFEVDWRGRSDRLLFPRRAGSWYHQSKVHDTHNVEMACRLWGLRSTDIMQGVVYGSRIDGGPSELATRFDFDQCFGTVINRFCAQAVIGMALSPYGKGNQMRGFLPLRDVMTCLTLALENPPEAGEYRTFNQFDRVYSVNQLAETVQGVAKTLGLEVPIRSVANPRIEAEEHFYRPISEKLRALGYRPTGDLQGEIALIIKDLLPHGKRIEKYRKTLVPDINWDPTRNPSIRN